MSDRGRFSGFKWHVEYHTTDRKKEKAADCIYLTEDRICENKKSLQYQEKCFVASSCPLRVKETSPYVSMRLEEVPSTVKLNKQVRIKKINCTIPKNCVVYSKAFGQGKYVDFDEKSMTISVQFGEKIARFMYPDAIFNGHIFVPQFVTEYVLQDLSESEKG